MKTLAALLASIALAAPAAAQARRAPAAPQTKDDSLSIRGIAFASVQQFAASKTFDAVFGSATQPWFGGGVSLTERGYFLDLTAARFKKTGQRAFALNNDTFPLGIPLTATITSFEVTFGYRFLRRSRMIPYVGAGGVLYGYKETSSFADASENVDTSHGGFLALGGAEFRLAKWIGAAAEFDYTYVPGILGSGGLSQSLGEKDLGGISGRFKLVIGR